MGTRDNFKSNEREYLLQTIALMYAGVDYIQKLCEQEQKITHKPHIDKALIKCLHILKNEIETRRAHLKRIETIGR